MRQTVLPLLNGENIFVLLASHGNYFLMFSIFLFSIIYYDQKKKTKQRYFDYIKKTQQRHFEAFKEQRHCEVHTFTTNLHVSDESSLLSSSLSCISLLSRFRYKSKSAMDVKEAMKKQNEVAMILSWHLFSTVAKHSNSVFSPASITAAFTMMASGPGSSPISDQILSFLRSSSIDELNSVFRVITTVVLADGSNIGGPTIKVANGAWIDQSFSIGFVFQESLRDFLQSCFGSSGFQIKGTNTLFALFLTNLKLVQYLFYLWGRKY